MYCIIDVDYLRDFSITLNDDIIDCFTEKKTSDLIIKEEKLEESITKEEIKTLDGLIFAENIANYNDRQANKEKTKTFVTGLKIRYSGKIKSKK